MEVVGTKNLLVLALDRFTQFTVVCMEDADFLPVQSLKETFKVKAVPYQRKLNISKRPGVPT